jgi:hypothetical protein
MSTQTKPVPADESVPYASVAASAEEKIPTWVGVMVAVVIVGSMLGGGGLWYWSYHSKPDPRNLAEVRPSVASGALARSVAPAPVPQTRNIAPGIQQTSSTNYIVTAGDFTLAASRSANATEWTINLGYRKGDLLTADQQAARMARMRLPNDPIYAKSLNVTNEQVEKLKKLPAVTATSPRLTVTTADHEKLKTMWSTFIAANPPKPDEAAKLVAAVEQTGKANLESFRASLLDGVKEIQGILTPEQIAAFKL